MTFRASHGESRAYLAWPAGSGPWPGMIVLHDIFGMTTDLRRQCDWLAGAGYLALGPDLYSWGRKITCIRATMNDLKNGRGRAFDDIEAARARLAGDEDCTGKVGVIGYCMSGGFPMTSAGAGFRRRCRTSSRPGAGTCPTCAPPRPAEFAYVYRASSAPGRNRMRYSIGAITRSITRSITVSTPGIRSPRTPSTVRRCHRRDRRADGRALR